MSPYPNLEDTALFQYLREIEDRFLGYESEDYVLQVETLEDFAREEGLRVVDGRVQGLRVG